VTPLARMLDLLSDASAVQLTVMALVVVMVAFQIYIEIVSLVKELSVSPREWRYLKYAQAREERDAMRERYDREHTGEKYEDGDDVIEDDAGDPDSWEHGDLRDLDGDDDDREPGGGGLY